MSAPTQRYSSVLHYWIWWATFILCRRRGETVIRSYREAQKATARLYR